MMAKRERERVMRTRFSVAAMASIREDDGGVVLRVIESEGLFESESDRLI